jgi:hypothetical protein
LGSKLCLLSGPAEDPTRLVRFFDELFVPGFPDPDERELLETQVQNLINREPAEVVRVCDSGLAFGGVMSNDKIKREILHLPRAPKSTEVSQQAQQNQSNAVLPAARLLGRKPLFGR